MLKIDKDTLEKISARLINANETLTNANDLLKIEDAQLSRVANREKLMPKNFISKDGFGITAAARKYLEPLIRGESYPPYDKHGLPRYVRLKKKLVKKLLPDFKV